MSSSSNRAVIDTGSNGVSGSNIPPISRDAVWSHGRSAAGNPRMAAIASIGSRLVNASTMSSSPEVSSATASSWATSSTSGS